LEDDHSKSIDFELSKLAINTFSIT